MTVTVLDIIRVMDQIAPSSLAEEWDNAGLQIGSYRWPVRVVGVALDPTAGVIDAAARKRVDLLITHHPLIFEPLAKIDVDTPTGAIIESALQRRLAVFSAHTNMDKCEGGLNHVLANRLGLKNLEVLAAGRKESSFTALNGLEINKQEGLGRIGHLERPIQLQKLAARIKKKLNINRLKFVGKPDLIVTRAAVCTGSGSSLLSYFIDSDAQVYISGDLRYHDARDIEARGLGLIDIGHFTSEYLIVEDLSERLKKILSDMNLKVKVAICGSEKDPFVFS